MNSAAPRPMRRGYVVELQTGDGTLVMRRQTPVANTALQSYRQYMKAKQPRQVLVLFNEREITGTELRVLAEQKVNT